ncbi:hypothetical protein [Chryseoglobus sp. 28M-23]|uniref:hypothetical protein n=1 Tax=Chryseoglobus sp. 28M-23 TaxID=2772253 RepID=UPI00174652BD|nr:hypothetical protein [Chryseoglobus sp. 28M-23]QOD93048.1 hypothetical protein IE160_08870 [Chryseoglobus sp. 28M-23]
MRAAALFRWGLTCLLLVPFTLLAWWVLPFGAALGWLALALILLGGALNLAAVARGLRSLSPRELGGADSAASTPLEPRQRILYPFEPEPLPDPAVRRRIGAGAALALLGLIAFGAWTLAVEQPLAIAQGQLTLEQTYAAWGTVSQTGFFIALTIWVLLGLVLAGGLAVLGRLDGPTIERVLAPRRFLALAAIVGSVIVTAAFVPYIGVGISLPDDLPFPAFGVQSPGSTAFGMLGFALSATAILLTVPSWRPRTRTP